MRRRAFVKAFGAAVVLPFDVRSESSRVWRIGFLSARSRESAIEVPPFLDGMRELGYIDGKNVLYEWRFADGRYERLPQLAEDLVRLKVDLIAASGTPTVQAVQKATKAIPVVMVAVVDPVRLGFVASLARPGGNITGVSNLNEVTWTKQVDALVETIPKLSQIAVLVNPDEQFSESAYKSIETAARLHQISATAFRARNAGEIERAFVSMKQRGSQALVVAGGALFVQQKSQLVALAAMSGLPAVYYRREFVEAGGLMSYGRNAAIGYRRAAAYVDKILKGARPQELPVEQPTVIELVVNRKAAEKLGVTFPPSVLARADRIIN